MESYTQIECLISMTLALRRSFSCWTTISCIEFWQGCQIRYRAIENICTGLSGVSCFAHVGGIRTAEWRSSSVTSILTWRSNADKRSANIDYGEIENGEEMTRARTETDCKLAMALILMRSGTVSLQRFGTWTAIPRSAEHSSLIYSALLLLHNY